MRSLRPSIDRVASVNIDDITSKESNRDILRRLRHNDFFPPGAAPNNDTPLIIDRFGSYAPEGGPDFGWVGYFIGQNTSLETLEVWFRDCYAEGNEHFFRGLSHNTSILKASFNCINANEAVGFVKSLTIFLANNTNLKELELYECDLGVDGWHSLTLALTEPSSKSLPEVILSNNQIEDDQLVDTISALRTAQVPVSLDEVTCYGGAVGALVDRLSSVCHVTQLFVQYASTDEEHGLCVGLDITFSNIGNISCSTFGKDDLMGSIKALFERSHGLTYIEIDCCCRFGADEWRTLAVAIGSCTSKSLKGFYFSSDIQDEQLAGIMLALSVHPNLEKIWFRARDVGVKGCVALGTLAQNSAAALKMLDIDVSTFSADGLEVLAKALSNRGSLETICLPGPQIRRAPGGSSFRDQDYQTLATAVLRSPESNLKTLKIGHISIDYEQVTTLLEALAHNQSLTSLVVNLSSAVVAQCSPALSQLLCDTSSVNDTYHSNHTLTSFCRYSSSVGHCSSSDDMRYYLELNSNADKGKVAVTKILRNHPMLDMRPFFEWDLKLLPHAVSWFDNANDIPWYSDVHLGQRKLYAVYQFIRAMPTLCADGRRNRQVAPRKRGRGDKAC